MQGRRSHIIQFLAPFTYSYFLQWKRRAVSCRGGSPWWHIGQGEPPARAPRGLSIVAIQLHVDREAPATTECVLRTRVEGQDLAQGSVPLAGFLI